MILSFANVGVFITFFKHDPILHIYIYDTHKYIFTLISIFLSKDIKIKEVTNKL
jgi:hypothetical protein